MLNVLTVTLTLWLFLFFCCTETVQYTSSYCLCIWLIRSKFIFPYGWYRFYVLSWCLYSLYTSVFYEFLNTYEVLVLTSTNARNSLFFISITPSFGFYWVNVVFFFNSGQQCLGQELEMKEESKESEITSDVSWGRMKIYTQHSSLVFV